MVKAGYWITISHDTPESAAAMVNNIKHEPMLGWQQSNVQLALQTFCKRYARVTADGFSDSFNL